MIRLFVADSRDSARRGLAAMFDREPDVQIVGDAATQARARSRIMMLRPDVVILDVTLIDGSGIDLCRDLTAQMDVPPAFLILTANTDDEVLFAAIMAGAAGYLLRHAAVADVLAAVRTVATGRSMVDPDLVASVLTRLRRFSTPEPTRDLSLSESERRILNLIGAGLTNRQIGDQLFLTEKTVKNYVSVIFRKLGVSSRTQAALFTSGPANDVTAYKTS